MRAKRRHLLAAGIAVAAGAAFGVEVVAQEKVIRVLARKFEFVPNDIELKKGEPVVLEFTSADVLMGFSLPDLRLRTDIPPGRVTRLRLTPERAGTFEFVCDNFCGEFHEDMAGRIRVTE
ncbi:MAG TPA: cupredoxin domain-containing protein [Burkholderiales bacterium]|nr:cupredoxin domain-containing protein [Burkholderiales bacterium]